MQGPSQRHKNTQKEKLGTANTLTHSLIALEHKLFPDCPPRAAAGMQVSTVPWAAIQSDPETKSSRHRHHSSAYPQKLHKFRTKALERAIEDSAAATPMKHELQLGSTSMPVRPDHRMHLVVPAL
jgi:hypothetical protein